MWAGRRLVAFRATQKAWGLLRWLQLKGRGLHLRLTPRTATFRLSRWYGRTGNNLQQLIVVIAHAEAFGGSVQLDQDFIEAGPLRDIVRPFRLDFGDGSARGGTILMAGTFFHCTDVFLIEHLHPRMLDTGRVEVDMLPLPGFREAWLRSADRVRLLLDWQPRSRDGGAEGLRSAPGGADPP